MKAFDQQADAIHKWKGYKQAEIKMILRRAKAENQHLKPTGTPLEYVTDQLNSWQIVQSLGKAAQTSAAWARDGTKAVANPSAITEKALRYILGMRSLTYGLGFDTMLKAGSGNYCIAQARPQRLKTRRPRPLLVDPRALSNAS